MPAFENIIKEPLKERSWPNAEPERSLPPNLRSVRLQTSFGTDYNDITPSEPPAHMAEVNERISLSPHFNIQLKQREASLRR